MNRNMADTLRAEVGDIVYLSDARGGWVASVRSTRSYRPFEMMGIRWFTFRDPLLKEGSLQVERRHTIEKIL